MAKADSLKSRMGQTPNRMVAASIDMANGLPVTSWQRRDDGKIQVGHFVVSKTGLEIQGDVAHEEYDAFFEGVRQMQTAVQWLIGDWLNYGERKYGQTYAQASERTGLDVHTLQNYAWVCKQVELSRRREDLSFSHHGEVASLAPDEQAIWLERAAMERWSGKRLRQELQGYQEQQADAPVWDKRLTRFETLITKRRWSAIPAHQRRQVVDRLSQLLHQLQQWGVDE